MPRNHNLSPLQQMFLRLHHYVHLDVHLLLQALQNIRVLSDQFHSLLGGWDFGLNFLSLGSFRNVWVCLPTSHISLSVLENMHVLLFFVASNSTTKTLLFNLVHPKNWIRVLQFSSQYQVHGSIFLYLSRTCKPIVIP